MVVPLLFPNQQPFATGAAEYAYRPATQDEFIARLIIDIEIEGVHTSAVVDTGTPYVICSPHIASRINFTTRPPLQRMRLLMRGTSIAGELHRVNLRFIALIGASLDIEATAFIPDPAWEEAWRDLPSFIGLSGCLERIRFAVDPTTDIFYFGPF